MPVFICQGCGTEYPSWGGSCAKCGTTEIIKLSELSDRMIDKVVKGKYRIVKKLGQGGMGAVYLAEQPGLGQKLALKFLKSEFSTDAEIARRFLNETKSYALVAHPNAVTLHDFGQDEDGNLFIAMEYCEGVDLKKVLAEQRRLSLVDAIDVGLQVADVLANAHSKGVVHRDLKPENVMLRKGMRGLHVKVLDFGIARLMNAGTKLTMAGSIAGTPRYMSPEQVEGGDVDHRADVYALGVLLYEVLTGVQPFDGMTIAEILRKQVTQPMPMLRDHAPDLDHPEIDAVLQKACQKDRNQRFEDMTALASQLSLCMPTQAGRPSSLLTGLTNLPVANTTPTGLGTTPGNSGMASPSHPVLNADTLHATVMRPAEAGTQLDHRATPFPSGGLSKTINELQPKAAGDSVVLPPQKSKLPMIVGAVVLLGVAVGGYVMFAMPPAKPVAEVKLPEPVPDPLPPQPPPPKTPDQHEAEAAAAAVRSKDQFLRGMTEFNVGNLAEAQARFESVETGTPSIDEANAMLAKIKDINKKLASANGLANQGQCGGAIAIYQQVLKLNPKVADAVQGLSRCKVGLTPERLE